MPKWKVGQDYSTSQFCGFVTFIGGPLDGQRGLYDSNFLDGIGFCDTEGQVTHDYEPEAKGISWNYVYKGPFYWSHAAPLVGSPTLGWRRLLPT